MIVKKFFIIIKISILSILFFCIDANLLAFDNKYLTYSGLPPLEGECGLSGSCWNEKNEPVYNFNDFWNAFNMYYAHFETRGMDWDNQYNLYRTLIDSTTPNGELWCILTSMIYPLDDGHTRLLRIHRDCKREFIAEDQSTIYFLSEFTDSEIYQLFNIAEDTLQANGFTKVKNTKSPILKYATSENYGYIQIKDMELGSNSQLEEALNDIENDFNMMDGYILDLRNNPGGPDNRALSILGRFTDFTRLCARRITKTGVNSWSKEKQFYVQPLGSNQFTGPVVLITCDSCFSGADAFALFSMVLPHIYRIGDHTNGDFSYDLSGRMPNNWIWFLSDMKYMDPNYVCYEGQGIPVDQEVLNSQNDLVTGIDPTIVAALNHLDSNSY